MSRIHWPLGYDPFSPSALTPGSLGHNDAADPDKPKSLLGDTPGPLGIFDHGDPTYLAGPIVRKSSANDPRNYFGPSGADVTTSGNITTVIRRIPLVPKRSSMSCWVAAGTMVLGYPPSVTKEMWISKKYYMKKGDDVGGLNLLGHGHLQKFIKLNGLILYHRSNWTLKGIESRLRTRSAFFYPLGAAHVVVIAGIKVNKQDADSSKLIIYDTEPVGKGQKTEVSWGKLRAEWTKMLDSLRKLDPGAGDLLSKGRLFGYGHYFLHR